MAGLKELRTRIESIKSTQKITSAMKMVAAARLRKAQMLTDSSASYNANMAEILARADAELQQRKAQGEVIDIPHLMQAKDNLQKYLLVVFTSDRGLCGSYNANVAKVAIQRIRELQSHGKDVSVMCIGRKGRDIIRRRYPDIINSSIDGIARKGADYTEASIIAEQLCDSFERSEFDVCEVVCSHFHSVMNRDVKSEQFLPIKFDLAANDNSHVEQKDEDDELAEENPSAKYLVNGAAYDYETSAEGIISGLVVPYIKAKFFAYIINSQASEQGARMTSMDNATRNAKDMISKLTLKYNRLRQSSITTELIEIIAGAEAL